MAEIYGADLEMDLGDAAIIVEGGDITTQALTVTENGTYTAPAGKAYSPVTVNVPHGGDEYPPDYTVREAIRVSNLVNTRPNSNVFRILVLSDAHIDKTNAQWVTSAKHAGQAASIIRRALDIDCCMHLGDSTAGSSTTTYDVGVEEIGMMRNNLSDAFGELPQFWTVGNHDNLNYSSAAALGDHTMLYAEQIYPMIGALSTGTVDSQNQYGGYCYQDFTSKKIRVICLNSVEVRADSGSKSQWISGRQCQWLADRLYEVGSKSDAAQWGVIVCAHHPVDWMTFRVSQIFKAYLNGLSVSLPYDGVTITKNFSGANNAKLICQLHGHVHNYLSGKVHAIGYANNAPVDEGEMDYWRLAIPNVCFGRNNEYGRNSQTESNGLEFGETTTYYKTADSGADTAFCVVTIDLANGVIYADHYGLTAGYDRVINYVSSSYTVTIGNVGKATVNAPAFVAEGGSLTATVSVPSGYTIDSVTVTMGGNVVSGAYSGGTISIASVTGDVVITAVTSGYTNLIDTIGYTDGKRLSTSTGNLSDGTGYTTSGIIDLSDFVDKGEAVVIRTSGVDMRQSSHSLSSWAYYRPDGTFVGGGYLTAGEISSFGTAAFDSNGNMTLTIPADSPVLTAAGNRPKLRIAGHGAGANWIVTVNEPIE